MNPAASAGNPPVAALATAPGAAGVAVVRLSGDGALAIADRLCAGARVPPSALPGGSFRLYRLRDPRDGSAIDEALVLVFRAPHSYTGEDVAEFQTHGGRAAPTRVLDALLALGAAPAGPGEFTRRAFLSGRIGLDRAEAVMDLVAAQGDRAARAAAEQLAGALGRRVDALYDALLALCADLEATLDFTDEEAEGLSAPIRFDGRAAALSAALLALAATAREGRLLREGALVVLAGPPNAGKSTLFNRLLGERRAIVAPEAGTTRDSLEETLLLRGIPIRLVDTAGLRDASSPIEREGVERARSLAARADLVLSLFPWGQTPPPRPWGQTPPCGQTPPPRGQTPADQTPSHRGQTPSSLGPKILFVETKADLAPSSAGTDPVSDSGSVPDPAFAPANPSVAPLRVSAVTGEGMDALEAAILTALGTDPAASDGGVVAVSERHAALLREAASSVSAAREAFAAGAEAAAVPAAGHLRAAAESLGRITGRSYTEDLLDAVFSRFCVGK